VKPGVADLTVVGVAQLAPPSDELELITLPLSIQAKLLRTIETGEVRKVGSNRALRVDTPEASRDMLLGVLERRESPAFKAASEIVVLNAGVALYAANVSADVEAGIALARRTLESGAALAKLEEFVGVTRQIAGKPVGGG